jgi:hypothetical protein
MARRRNKTALTQAEKRDLLKQRRADKRTNYVPPQRDKSIKAPKVVLPKFVRVGDDQCRKLIAGSQSYYVFRAWRSDSHASEAMEKVGNIVRVFHGTKFRNIHTIAQESLRVESASSWGAFGPGIYTTPALSKAISYTSEEQGSRMVLRCRVALGKTMNAGATGRYTLEELRGLGYDSVTAYGGTPINGAWGGSFMETEYVVYRNEQAVIDFVLELRPLNELNTVKQRSYAPCSRDGVICANLTASDHRCVFGSRGNRYEPQYCLLYSPGSPLPTSSRIYLGRHSRSYRSRKSP